MCLSTQLLNRACRYRAYKGKAPSTDTRRQQIESMLPNWWDWAKQCHGLSTIDKQMCMGPDADEPVEAYDRAEVAGVKFTCAPHQKKARAKTCIVMVRAGEGCMAVGQVRVFIKWLPPWAVNPDEALELADVQWYGAKGVNAELCNAPQVTREFKSDLKGNLCMVEEIVPCHVCLVPHLGHADWWQVLYLGEPA